MSSQQIQDTIISGLNAIHSGENLSGPINQLFGVLGGGGISLWSPLIDITDGKNSINLYIELPGVKKETVVLEFHNNKVILSGEKIRPYTEQSLYVRKKEICYGKFKRTIILPISVNKKNNVSTFLSDGVLNISIDKTNEGYNKFKITIKGDDD